MKPMMLYCLAAVWIFGSSCCWENYTVQALQSSSRYPTTMATRRNVAFKPVLVRPSSAFSSRVLLSKNGIHLSEQKQYGSWQLGALALPSGDPDMDETKAKKKALSMVAQPVSETSDALSLLSLASSSSSLNRLSEQELLYEKTMTSIGSLLLSVDTNPASILENGSFQDNQSPISPQSVASLVDFRKVEEEEELLAFGNGTATVRDLVPNLVKAIVGSGVLSLPAGIASFGSTPSTLGPALFLVVGMGILSAVGFTWIARVCALTQSSTYREAWSKSMGEDTGWIPAISAAAKTLLGCLSYSMVLADCFRPFLTFIPDRTMLLWFLTVFVLLPLCWLRDLKSLMPFSIMGVVGMIYTVSAMTYRFWNGDYLIGSDLLNDVPDQLQPAFGDGADGGWLDIFSPQSIVLVSMLSTAYMCHFNAPKFYMELQNNTMPRVNQLVAWGFGIAMGILVLTSGIGFATFGSHSSGFVLNNYSPNDGLIQLSRLAVSASLICSYPFNFQGLRDGILDAVGVPQDQRTDALLNPLTLVLLTLVTALASVLTNVSFVVALGGATLGNLLVFIYPALMLGRIEPGSRLPALGLGVMGVVFGCLGTFLSIQKVSFH